MGNYLKELASAYIWVFGLLHLIAVPLGLTMEGINPWISRLVLSMVWAFSWLGIYWEKRPLRVLLAIIFSAAWAYEWLQLFSWVPPWSALQHIIASLMDLLHALSFAILAEVWKR